MKFISCTRRGHPGIRDDEFILTVLVR